MAETKQRVNEAAEKHLGVEHKVLDKGFAKLVAYQGIDETVVAAARVSYGQDVDLSEKERNTKLIHYLMKHRHTSPFEMCSLTFELKMPIFVARELVRHRTASMSEISGRYAELPEEYYVPELSRVQKQSTTNKQGSGEPLDETDALFFMHDVDYASAVAFQNYKFRLGKGIARELARISLPLSTYTRMYWQMDLHNLLHFLKLRLADNAQYEIRMLAQAIADVVKDAFPIVWAAFDNHVLNAVTLSKDEVTVLSGILASELAKGTVRGTPACYKDNLASLNKKLDTAKQRTEKG